MAHQQLDPNQQALQENIDHIVVLMLENRSFDNLLGWLYADQSPPDGQHYEGLTRDLWNPLDNIDADGVPFIEKVPVEKIGEAKKRFGREIPNPQDFTLPKPDPGEGYKDTNHQLFQKYASPSSIPRRQPTWDLSKITRTRCSMAHSVLEMTPAIHGRS